MFFLVLWCSFPWHVFCSCFFRHGLLLFFRRFFFRHHLKQTLGALWFLQTLFLLFSCSLDVVILGLHLVLDNSSLYFAYIYMYTLHIYFRPPFFRTFLLTLDIFLFRLCLSSFFVRHVSLGSFFTALRPQMPAMSNAGLSLGLWHCTMLCSVIFFVFVHVRFFAVQSEAAKPGTCFLFISCHIVPNYEHA